jgi:hypothetical protein
VYIVRSKHLAEKVIRLFRSLGGSSLELMINQSDPSTDARQGPHIKLNFMFRKRSQRTDLQTTSRSPAAKNNRTLHG